MAVNKPVNKKNNRKRGICVICTQEKTLQARGLCANCYMKQRRRGITAVAQLMEAAEQAQNYAEKARQVIEQYLPEAAKDITTASRVSAEKGDGTAARWILQGTPVALPSGRTRILVEPQKDQQSGPAMPTINIGIALGGQKTVNALPSANPQSDIHIESVDLLADNPDPQKA